ncbi:MULTISPECIES: antitoxin VbhA family protein [Sphingomonas]|uniref:Antitoxin VbhA family protein n=1 Tax=Sphingomonas kyungheensis TaxID=1069987 RepID=A0ABU8H6U1_9SPHN|nr:antitoxin VbhA family protein [Sphingomonas sp. CV7422]
MDAVAPLPVSPLAITAAERKRRIDAVNFARGSVRYEGGILISEIEAIAARFIDGELTNEQFVTAVKESDTVRLG